MTTIGRRLAPLLARAADRARSSALDPSSVVERNASSLVRSLPLRSPFRAALIKALGAEITPAQVAKIFGVSSSYASAIKRSGGTLLDAAHQTIKTRHRVPLLEEELTKEWLRQTLPVNSGSRTGAHVQRESDDELYKRYKDQFQHLLLLIANEIDEQEPSKNSRLTKILQFAADKQACDDQRQALLMGTDSRLGLQSPVLWLRRLPQDQRVSIFQLIFSFVAPAPTFHPLPLSRKTFTRIKKQLKISKSAVYWGQFYCLVCSRSLTCPTRHSHMLLFPLARSVPAARISSAKLQLCLTERRKRSTASILRKPWSTRRRSSR